MLIGHTLADATGRVLAVDESVAEMLHRTQRQLAGMSYLDLTHAGDRAMNALGVTTLRAGCGPTTIRKRYLRPDGSVVESDVLVSRLVGGSDDGRLVGTLMRIVPDSAASSPRTLWRAAKRLLHVDRVRRTTIGADLFADDAWTILLRVYLAEAEASRLSTDDLVAVHGGPQQVVERWIKALIARTLVDPVVDRRAALQLTADGVRQVEAILGEVDGPG